MLRWLVALLALVGAAGLALAAPGRDWTQVATPAPQGSYVIGNPKARVKLVEFASYTCPHCRHFGEQSAATLGAMIRSGSTSLEIRNALHDKLDIAAALIARCAGARAFPRVHAALYAQQDAWFERGAAWDAANGARMALYSQAAQVRAIADAAGLSDLARANGVAPAAVEACFADPAPLARTLEVANAVGQQVQATPSFLLNGRLVERVDWAHLEPMLRAAGAK